MQKKENKNQIKLKNRMNDGQKKKILNVNESMKKKNQKKTNKKQKFFFFDNIFYLLDFFSFDQTLHGEQEKELAELREKKFKQWLERKDHEAMMAIEFAKLKIHEELATTGSPVSANNTHKNGDHRAFRR